MRRRGKKVNKLNKLLLWLKQKLCRTKGTPEPQQLSQHSVHVFKSMHRPKIPPSEDAMLRRVMENQRYSPKPSSKFFKPRPSLERKTWKPDKKPEESD